MILIKPISTINGREIGQTRRSLCIPRCKALRNCIHPIKHHICNVVPAWEYIVDTIRSDLEGRPDLRICKKRGKPWEGNDRRNYGAIWVDSCSWGTGGRCCWRSKRFYIIRENEHWSCILLRINGHCTRGRLSINIGSCHINKRCNRRTRSIYRKLLSFLVKRDPWRKRILSILNSLKGQRIISSQIQIIEICCKI